MCWLPQAGVTNTTLALIVAHLHTLTETPIPPKKHPQNTDSVIKWQNRKQELLVCCWIKSDAETLVKSTVWVSERNKQKDRGGITHTLAEGVNSVNCTGQRKQ